MFGCRLKEGQCALVVSVVHSIWYSSAFSLGRVGYRLVWEGDRLINRSSDQVIHVRVEGGADISGFISSGGRFPELRGWPVEPPDAVGANSTVADVESDGDMEVVASGFYSMFSGNDDAFIMAWHHDGVRVDGFPILMDNQMIFHSAPTLCDLNGDGKLDIGVGTWKRYPLDEGYVHFFALDAPYDPDRIEWGQYSHDIRHTGLYAQPEPPVGRENAETPPGPRSPRSFFLSQNYPNPFNPSTTMTCEIPEGNEVLVTFAIFDIRGRQVRSMVEGRRSAGRYSMHWGGRDDHGRMSGSGIYLYPIKAGDYLSRRKMLLTR